MNTVYGHCYLCTPLKEKKMYISDALLCCYGSLYNLPFGLEINPLIIHHNNNYYIPHKNISQHVIP